MRRILCFLGFHQWERHAISEIKDEPGIRLLTWWERVICCACEKEGEPRRWMCVGDDRWADAFVEYPLWGVESAALHYEDIASAARRMRDYA